MTVATPGIMFVHGALSSPKSFQFIKNGLTSRELPHSFSDFRYDIRREMSNDIVPRLAAQLTPLTKKHDCLTLVGHSYGGVLAIAAARELLQLIPTLKLKIITLASPLGGSAMASFFRALKPGSTFFKNIGAYDKFMQSFNKHPLPCRVRSVITTEGAADWMSDPNDGVVTIASQLAYEQDPNFHPIKIKLNHFEVLLSDQTIGHIEKELAK